MGERNYKSSVTKESLNDLYAWLILKNNKLVPAHYRLIFVWDILNDRVKCIEFWIKVIILHFSTANSLKWIDL